MLVMLMLNMEKECVSRRKLLEISPIMKRKGRTKIGEIDLNLANRLKPFRRKISHHLITFSALFVITSTAFVLQALSDTIVSSNQSESKYSGENLISNSQVVNVEQAVDHQPDSNRSRPIKTRNDEESMKFPLYMRILATFACLLIFTVGVCGNLLVPIVVIKTKYLRNSTNLFLINLAVADLLVLIICEPTVLIELHSRPETWLLGESMCKISNFVEMSAANASIFTILAISFERYYAICKPLKAGYKCTRLRATIIICLIWLLSLIFTSPILIMAKSSKTIYIDGSLVDNCILETDPYWHRMYVFVSMFAFFCLPLIVLMLVYWRISRRLIRENLAISSAKTSSAAANKLLNENCKVHQHKLPRCSQYKLKRKGSQILRKAASFKHSVSTFPTSKQGDNKQTAITQTGISAIDESKVGQSSISLKRPLKLTGRKSLSLDHHHHHLKAEVSPKNQLLCKANNCNFNNCQHAHNRTRSAHESDGKHFVVKNAHLDTTNIIIVNNEQTNYEINPNEAIKQKQSQRKQQQIDLFKLIKNSNSESLHRLVYQLFCFERVTHRSSHTRDELNHQDPISSESLRHSQEVDNPGGSTEATDRNSGSHNDANSYQHPEQEVPFLPSVDADCSASMLATNQNSPEVSAKINLPTKYNFNDFDSKQEQTNRGLRVFGNTARNLMNGARGTFRFNKCPRQASVASSISISIPTQTNSTDLPSESSVDIQMVRNNPDHIKYCDSSSNSPSPDSSHERKRRQSPTKFEHHQPLASNNDSSREDDLHEDEEKEHSSSPSPNIQQEQHLVHFSNRRVINQSVFDTSLGKFSSNHLLVTTGTAVLDSRFDEESLVNNSTNYAASSQISSNCDNANSYSGEQNHHSVGNTDVMHKISTEKSKIFSDSSLILEDKNKNSEQISDNFSDKQIKSLNLNQSNHDHDHHFRFNFSKMPYRGKRRSDPVICNHHRFKNNKTQSTKLLVVQDLSKKQQMDSRRQVVIMLAFVVAAFFLLLFPFRVFTIWLLSSTDDQVQSLGMETYYNLTYFCRILIYLHSAINPIAYNLISIKFRRAFMSILLCHESSTRRNFTTTKTQHKILKVQDKSTIKSNIDRQRETIIPKNSISSRMIEF